MFACVYAHVGEPTTLAGVLKLRNLFVLSFSVPAFPFSLCLFLEQFHQPDLPTSPTSPQTLHVDRKRQLTSMNVPFLGAFFGVRV